MMNFLTSTLIFFVFNFSFFAQAEFSNNNIRYLSVYDFQNKLNPFFSEIWAAPEFASVITICLNSKSAFGFNSPVDGLPNSSSPTNATIRQLQACVRASMSAVQVKAFKSQISQQAKNTLLKFIPKEILERAINDSNFTSWYSLTFFNTLSGAEKDLFVQFYVENLLGLDEVIKSYGLIENVDLYRDFLKSQISKSDTIYQASEKLMLLLVLRDEFLTY